MELDVANHAVDTKTATALSALPGLDALWQTTQGTPDICIAVLDGPVDLEHPCFQGANLKRLPTLVTDTAGDGMMSGHGTHTTSIIFGQSGSPLHGIAPQCRGLIVPVFSDHRGSLSQLDLARAIEQAVDKGAQVINISGGELSPSGQARPELERAVRLCRNNNVLIVAAAGNDGCDCLHVPAALDSVLVVGALDSQGHPLGSSNWGKVYQTQGLLAPGQHIWGAQVGGGLTTKTGTSFATPIVSGIAALLLSLQAQQGQTPNPQAVREALLASAKPCNPEATPDSQRCLAGLLHISGAHASLQNNGDTHKMSEENPTVQPSEEQSNLSPVIAPNVEWSRQNQFATNNPPPTATGVQAAEAPPPPTNTVATAPAAGTVMPSHAGAVTASEVTASDCGCDGVTSSSGMDKRVSEFRHALAYTGVESLVYAIGTLGYDFGTEARRDMFVQQMPQAQNAPPPNPYNAQQFLPYLDSNPSATKSLILTLNIELTPIYAIQPEGPFANDVYKYILELLKGQIQPDTDPEYISRISLPGLLTGRSITLFSGQVVPVVVPQKIGMYGWNVNQLSQLAVQAAGGSSSTARNSFEDFLNRVYYEFRNLGQTSHDRALNFAATNAFQAASAWQSALQANMQLADITVKRSSFCRIDSDCWDVRLSFFDPENDRKANKIYLYTIDVSDEMPVTMGPVRTWSAPGAY
ncbi:MAG: PatA/PatG family cyanobactin maturation protease [Spirulina sp. SIO3F2]|nr:PatA/PatG family cyanobactin maturation protease [Spirulina sp. SIO3F2]